MRSSGQLLYAIRCPWAAGTTTLLLELLELLNGASPPRGSEVAAEFERECRRRDIRLFVLPPRAPKLLTMLASRSARSWKFSGT